MMASYEGRIIAGKKRPHRAHRHQIVKHYLNNPVVPDRRLTSMPHDDDPVPAPLRRGLKVTLILQEAIVEDLKVEHVADQVMPCASARPPPSATRAHLNGGRPKADWWEDLWIEMCSQLYSGTLQPKKQADIENAMQQWITDHGYSAAVSTTRSRARRLWPALSEAEDR
jgi:hypothetical protein